MQTKKQRFVTAFNCCYSIEIVGIRLRANLMHRGARARTLPPAFVAVCLHFAAIDLHFPPPRRKPALVFIQFSLQFRAFNRRSK